MILSYRKVICFADAANSLPEKQKRTLDEEKEIVKYLSETPEEKAMNHMTDRLCLIHNRWLVVCFEECFWELEFALCRTRGEILKTGSIFYPRHTKRLREL